MCHREETPMPHHVLIVTTSTGTAGPDGPETGFDWVSVAAPYWRLHESGARVRFASPAGGKPPGDPATAADPGTERRAEGDRAGSVDMFLGDDAAVQGLARSLGAAEAAQREWDGILLADGLGGLWDLAQCEALAALLSTAWERGAVLAAIGAGTAALASVRVDGGRSITSGRRMTCLPDAAIDALLGPDVAPFYPETRLRAQGAQLWIAERGAEAAVLEDGRLITGQDARASAEVTLQMLEALDVYAFGAGRREDRTEALEAEEEEAGAPGAAGIETAGGETDPGEGTDPADTPGARAP
jgi:putative intracellular protease/amidase